MRKFPGIVLVLWLGLVPSVSNAQQRTSVPSRRQRERRATPPQSPVLRTLERIEEQLRSTRYAHVTRVNEREGRFEFDCSGMASWVLSRAHPEAHAAILRRNGRGRPVASDFFDVFSRAPTEHPREGWLRVAHVQDAQPGDVLAWRRPPTVASQNTGHVAFVVERPRRLDREGHRYFVRIVDSTSIPHGEDTRPTQHRSGYGHGTMLLYLDDPQGAPVGYGWYGSPTRLDFRTPIAIGRPVQGRCPVRGSSTNAHRG